MNRLSQGMGGWDKSKVINALKMVPPERLTPEFVAAVDRFSHGTSVEAQRWMIVVTLGKVLPERLTQDFVAAVDHFSQDMNAVDKPEMIEALSTVPPERLTQDFVAAVDRLGQDMERWDKLEMIKALNKVPSKCLTPEFVAAANSLSQKMSEWNKLKVINVLGNMLPERLTPEFVKAANSLSEGMNEWDKPTVIDILGKIQPVRLAAFEEAVNRLSQDRDVKEKIYVITALDKILPERLTLAFEEAVILLSQDMSGSDKAKVIEALAKVLPERFTLEFVGAVDRLSEGMFGQDKSSIIRILGYMPPDQLTLLILAFTDDVIRQVRDSVPEQEIINLINRLKDMQPDQYQAEIARTIGLYRHDAEDRIGVAFEVHNYAGMQVSINTNHPSAPTMRLDDAVMGKIREILHVKNIPVMSYEDAKTTLNAWIDRKYTNNEANIQQAKDAAFSRLASDVHYEQDIAITVTFLKELHPDKIDLWLDGFLGESIHAYKGGNGMSCTKGIGERIATGMRHVDRELDTLFAQAEGPALAKRFMAGLDLSDEKRRLAITEALVDLGLDMNSTAEDASHIFEQYMRESLASHGVSPGGQEYADQIKIMKELVNEGGFDTYIKPALGELHAAESRGIEKGKAEGKAEGEAKRNREVALEMLRDNESDAKITAEELDALKKL